ncbi:MAG: zinc ribbon domain-containing protein [Limnochordia bacterium]|jgi:DNA-directed RNA polymerase subunit RPC12/RpoP|nr:zinc ribbon domain-containing protein [Bacillota bacterium]NLL08964.1 zinc ribbon domain-containing protein [Bacillota bacterium]HBG09498.1 zinc ribbon domain-containing protein [Bacillota bacterium]
MFFIGIFGIQDKEEIIKTEQGVTCPVCGAYDRYEVIRAYTYFHIFFIPVWKWNRRYFIRTRCCQRVCGLDEELGQRIEEGQAVSISTEHLDCRQPAGRFCSSCGAQLHSAFNYCPYCGKRS